MVQKWGEAVRTDKDRLIEWLGDMLFDQSGADPSEYRDLIAVYEAKAEPWAEKIIEDMRLGIIRPDREKE